MSAAILTTKETAVAVNAVEGEAEDGEEFGCEVYKSGSDKEEVGEGEVEVGSDKRG